MQPRSILASLIVAHLSVGGLTSCDDKAESHRQALAELESESSTLRRDKKALEEKVKLLNEGAEKDAKEVMKQKDDAEAETQQAKEALEKVQDENEKLQQEFKEYKEKYKLSIRARMKGQKLPALATTDGRQFNDCEVVAVEDLGMKIRHANGAATVALENLPLEMQQMVAYSPVEVQAAEEEQKKAESLIAEMAEAAAKIEKGSKLKNDVSTRALTAFKTRIESRLKLISKMENENAALVQRPSVINRLRLQQNNFQLKRLRAEVTEYKRRTEAYIKSNSISTNTVGSINR